MNSSLALGMVLPAEAVCIRMGEARSASLDSAMFLCSHRSEVWPPAVDAVALFGCVTPHCADVISIQPGCAESADSPLMPSMLRYASIAIFSSRMSESDGHSFAGCRELIGRRQHNAREGSSNVIRCPMRSISLGQIERFYA